MGGTEQGHVSRVCWIQEVETTAGGPGAPGPGVVTREYVWGPGYADEIVCQLDYSGDPLGGTGVEPETYYYLQDANYNVVAVVAPAGGGYPAQVLYQYTYGPYGDVLAADVIPPPGAPPGWAPPVNRIGHQGLFFERLTGAIGDPALLPSDPSIPRTVRGLYHSRNRWLHVELGRFLTRDPAEAALPIITALAFNGATFYDSIDRLIPDEHYRDGLNLYEFVGSNPVRRNDPLGLQWGFDDDIDEIVGNMSGERAAAAAAAAAQIGMGLNVAAIIGHMAFSMLPGADAVALGVKLAMGKNVTWQDIGAAALSVGGAAVVLKYGAKFARAAGGYLRKLGQRAWGWLSRGARGLLGALRPTNKVYSARVLQRAADAGDSFHNFPQSFDDLIIQRGQIRKGSGGYVQYEYPGVINKDSGRYQIGGELTDSGDTIIITHRFFDPD